MTNSEVQQRLQDLDTSGIEETGGETDTNTGPTEMVIEGILPSYGSTVGGTEVVVDVLEMCDDPAVYFDGYRAMATHVAGDRITVMTPAVLSEGFVDVEVKCDGFEGALESGFYYWPDGFGLVGAYGEVSWIHFLGDYWIDEPESYGEAYLRFFQPADVDYGSFFGSKEDSCVSGYLGEAVTVFGQPVVAEEVQLSADTVSINLTYDVEEGWFSGVLNEEQFVRNASYQLEPIENSEPWPSYSVMDFLQTPSGELTITSPAMDGATVPDVRNDFDLKWSGANNGDYMVAVIHRESDDGSWEEVRCLLQDDGQHRLDHKVFQGWYRGGELRIRLGRVLKSSAMFEHDRSSSGVVGIYWVYGAAIQK